MVRLFIAFALAVAGVGVGGCVGKTVPAALTGEWQVSGQGPSGPDGQPGMSWLVELDITEGVWKRGGYPPWQESARITRSERKGRVVVLHLTQWSQNGSKLPDGKVELELAPDGKSLKFQGKTLQRVERTSP